MKKIRILAVLLAILMIPFSVLFACKPKEPVNPDNPDDPDNPVKPDTPVVLDDDGTRAGYLAFYHFDAATPGNLPDKAPYNTYLFAETTKQGGSYAIEKKFGSTTDGTLLIHRESGHSTDPYVNIVTDTTKMGDLEAAHMLQFKIRYEDGLFGSDFSVYGRKQVGNSGITQPFITFGNGYIKDCNEAVIYGDDEADKRGWLTISLLINDDARTYDIYIDGIKMTNNLAYNNSSYPRWSSTMPGLYRFSISSSKPGETFVYLDDICMQNGTASNLGIHKGSDVKVSDSYTALKQNYAPLTQEQVIKLYGSNTSKLKTEIFSSALLMSNSIALSKIDTSGDTPVITDITKDYGVLQNLYEETSFLTNGNSYFSVNIDGTIGYVADKTAEKPVALTGKYTMDNANITFEWDKGVTAPVIGETELKFAKYAEGNLTFYSDNSFATAIDGAVYTLYAPEEKYAGNTYANSSKTADIAIDTFFGVANINVVIDEVAVSGSFPYNVNGNDVTVNAGDLYGDLVFTYDAENDKFVYGEEELIKYVEDDKLGENERYAIKYTNFKTTSTISFKTDKDWIAKNHKAYKFVFEFYADKELAKANYAFLLYFDTGASKAEPGKGTYYSTSISNYKEGWNYYEFDITSLQANRDVDITNLTQLSIQISGWVGSIGIPGSNGKPDGEGRDGYTMYIGKVGFGSTVAVPMEGPNSEHPDCNHVDSKNGNKSLWEKVDEVVPGNCIIGDYYIEKCSLCGTTRIDKNKPIGEAAGHKPEGAVRMKPATCEDAGYYYQICSVCGTECRTGEEIAAKGHDYYDTIDWNNSIKTTTCKNCGNTFSVKVYSALIPFNEKLAQLGFKANDGNCVYADSTHNNNYSVGSLTVAGPSAEVGLDNNLLKINHKYSTFATVFKNGVYMFEYTRGAQPVDAYCDLEINDKIPAGSNLVVELDIMLGKKGDDGLYPTVNSTFKDRKSNVDIQNFFVIDNDGVWKYGSNSDVTVQLSEEKPTNFAFYFNPKDNLAYVYVDGILMGSKQMYADPAQAMAFVANDFRVSYLGNNTTAYNGSILLNNFMYYRADAPVCVVSGSSAGSEEYSGDIKLQDETSVDMIFPLNVSYLDVTAHLPVSVYTTKYVMQFKLNGEELSDGVLFEGVKRYEGAEYTESFITVKNGKLYTIGGALVSETTKDVTLSFVVNDVNGTVDVYVNGTAVPGGTIDFTADYANPNYRLRAVTFRNDCGSYTVSDFVMYTGTELK